jgi:hypothetical protein
LRKKYHFPLLERWYNCVVSGLSSFKTIFIEEFMGSLLDPHWRRGWVQVEMAPREPFFRWYGRKFILFTDKILTQVEEGIYIIKGRLIEDDHAFLGPLWALTFGDALEREAREKQENCKTNYWQRRCDICFCQDFCQLDKEVTNLR